MKKFNVLIIMSGSIACYKIPVLLRLLVKSSIEVKVIMTKNALNFISPITIQTIISEKVYTKMFEEEVSPQHIELSEWADILVIAPATANIIGKIANGVADDLATSVVLSFPSSKPFLIAPAMNTNMWQNPILQSNIEKISKIADIIYPIEKELACGKKGIGAMQEPEEIYKIIIERADR